MKKVLNFVVNTKNGQKVFNTICILVTISLVIGMFLSIPMFWMGNAYEDTWMNSVAPYFFYAFFAYAALILFLFIPYLWYIGTSEKYEGDARGIMKGMAIFCSIVPGGLLYSLIAKALLIPSGMYNIVGVLICGILYLWIVKTVFRKPFEVVQTFIPLR